MKRWYLYLFCSFIPLSFASETFNIMHWQTSGGMPIYFVARTEIPMVDVRVVCAAGSGMMARIMG